MYTYSHVYNDSDYNFPDILQPEQQQRPFNGLWSGTTRVGRYQKKHPPTHTPPDHRASLINFLHLQRSTASPLLRMLLLQQELLKNYDTIPCYQATQRNLSALCHDDDPTSTAMLTVITKYLVQCNNNFNIN